jgi:hypothetical protein
LKNISAKREKFSLSNLTKSMFTRPTDIPFDQEEGENKKGERT